MGLFCGLKNGWRTGAFFFFVSSILEGRRPGLLSLVLINRVGFIVFARQDCVVLGEAGASSLLFFSCFTVHFNLMWWWLYRGHKKPNSEENMHGSVNPSR